MCGACVWCECVTCLSFPTSLSSLSSLILFPSEPSVPSVRGLVTDTGYWMLGTDTDTAVGLLLRHRGQTCAIDFGAAEVN
jgi:hypothetical protein